MSSSQPAVGSIPASTGGVAYVGSPPPVGYPTRDGFDSSSHPPSAFPVTTKSKGDGFWKGCFAALCCCCVLDCCV